MRVLLSAAVVAALAVTPVIAQSDGAAVVRQPSPPVVPTEPQTEAKEAGPNAGLVTEIADRAEMMIGKPLCAEDGTEVGTVVGVVRESNGKVREIHADIGGVLGIGATRIAISPDEATVSPDGERLVARKSVGTLQSAPAVDG
jgi:hypothetical protein